MIILVRLVSQIDADTVVLPQSNKVRCLFTEGDGRGELGVDGNNEVDAVNENFYCLFRVKMFYIPFSENVKGVKGLLLARRLLFSAFRFAMRNCVFMSIGASLQTDDR